MSQESSDEGSSNFEGNCSITVRTCQESDNAWLFDLLQRSFPKEECVSRAQMKSWLKRDTSRAFIILSNSPKVPHSYAQQTHAMPKLAQPLAYTKSALMPQPAYTKPRHAQPKLAQHRIGFFLGSQFDGFYFGEYLAINPKVRNQGYGSKFLRNLGKILDQPMVFECELPEDSEIAMRRYMLYLRLGFFRYEYDYTMPALHEGDDPIPMCLMGAGERISAGKLDSVVRAIYLNAYPSSIHLEENEELIVSA